MALSEVKYVHLVISYYILKSAASISSPSSMHMHHLHHLQDSTMDLARRRSPEPSAAGEDMSLLIDPAQCIGLTHDVRKA